MDSYPKVLISHQAYPDLDEKTISSYYFIRRTKEDIYPFLGKYNPLELIDKILPNTTKRDVFVLSVSLYGYFDERHVTLKVNATDLNQYWNRAMPDFQVEQIAYSIKSGYSLYLRASKMYEQHIVFENENYYLSFWHKPTITNYWHFQLFTCDSSRKHLPREPKPGEKETKAEEKKLKRLAIVVLEYIISESICTNTEVTKFRCEDIVL